MSAPIRTIHHSRMSRYPKITPTGMSKKLIPPETREFIEGIAISVFTDMVNAGATFQQALSAVYVSGCENAAAALGEQHD